MKIHMKIMGLKHVKKKTVKTNPLMNLINFPLKKIGNFRILKWRPIFILGLCKGISPLNMALYGTVPPFKDPGIPIEENWEFEFDQFLRPKCVMSTSN